ARAVAAGLKVVNPVRDQFYGRREGTFADPFGYTWNIMTVTEDMPVKEMYRRFHSMMPPQKESKIPPVPKGYRTLTPYIVAQDAVGLIEFVKKTFDAEETFHSVVVAVVRNCVVQLGDSTMIIGDGGPGLACRGDSHLGA